MGQLCWPGAPTHQQAKKENVFWYIQNACPAWAIGGMLVQQQQDAWYLVEGCLNQHRREALPVGLSSDGQVQGEDRGVAEPYPQELRWTATAIHCCTYGLVLCYMAFLLNGECGAALRLCPVAGKVQASPKVDVAVCNDKRCRMKTHDRLQHVLFHTCQQSADSMDRPVPSRVQIPRVASAGACAKDTLHSDILSPLHGQTQER